MFYFRDLATAGSASHGAGQQLRRSDGLRKTPAPDHPRNNFDFIRICAATLVLVSHQMPINGRPEWTFAAFHSLGGVGVIVFFAMSGYLVCDSWQRDPHVIRFAARRLLRLWPGLAVAVIVSACVLGPLMSSLPPLAYVADRRFAHYFVLLRFNDAGELPGVFAANPLAAVNGSLWTLPIEVRWYGYLALAGVLGLVRWRWLLLALTIGMAIHYFVVFDVDHAGGRRGWKEELGLYFLAGACLQRFRTFWTRSVWKSQVAAMTLAALLWLVGKHHAGLWIVFTFTTIAVATRSWPGLRDAGRFGDFSYGVYIYAFPVQQTIVALTANRLSLLEGTLASLAVTYALAALSWHVVEAPALRLKPASRSRFGSIDWLTGLLPGRR